MTENTTTAAAPAEVKLTLSLELATALLPTFAWLTRAETPKGGSARGTASFWSFVGGMRPSIATLVSLQAENKLHGDAFIGEALIEAPEGDDFPATYVYTQGTGKAAKRFTTRQFHGMWILGVDDKSPLAIPAGVTVSDLTKAITAVMPDAMEQIKAQREEARKAAEKKAAGDLMENTIKDLVAAIEVAKKLGLDITAQSAMLAAFEKAKAEQEKAQQ
ncbi:hypothetical protein [Streptosporangium lutulentum]|uniref:Uncharacterized protein n=1 Tax=Streptosporangium lutulentum TaxID=1461250 RepID=A0ABT9QA88_9ACTN|nr:hypothetical protein [Streptosporangium lutulentum]MDP9843291.1 hypothetical protein [Streptosporangium lutulentum]